LEQQLLAVDTAINRSLGSCHEGLAKTSQRSRLAHSHRQGARHREGEHVSGVGKRRRFYEKPSEQATREKSEAARRAPKLARKQAIRDGLIAAPKKG
jgi:ribosomal protein S21